MEINIKGTPQEIADLLEYIGSDKNQNISIVAGKINDLTDQQLNCRLGHS